MIVFGRSAIPSGTRPMNSSSAPGLRYKFGPFVLDTAEGKLTRDGVRIKLQDLPYRFLLMLAENPGSILTREEVCQRLWPQNTFLEFDSSLGVAVRKVREALGDDAESRRYVETIPRRGYRFLVPVERENLLARAESAIPVLPPPGVHPKSRPLIRLATMAVGAIAILSIGAVTVRYFRRHPSAATEVRSRASQPAARRSIAVLGFRNLPGHRDDDWMSHAFTEMLSTELAADGSLRIVPDEDVALAKRDIAMADADSLALVTLGRLRRNPGADVVVLGSYTAIPGRPLKRIRLDIRVQDTLTGDTIAEDAVSGNEEELFEMVSRAGADLRTSLGIYPIGSEAASRLRAALPANSAAIRHYSEGSARLWLFDFVGAREELSKAVAADPSYPLAHSALSDAFWHLGYRSKATAEAQRALTLSTRLSQEEQLVIAGQYARTLADWPTAVKTYKTLFDLRRDNLNYGLLLAAAQLNSSPRDTIASLATLRALPPPAGEDARIDLLEASAQIGLNLSAAQAAAKRAIGKGTALGSPMVVARAYGVLCQQGSSLGVNGDEMARDCLKGMQAYAAIGDRNNEARTLNDFAGVYYARGDLRQAERMWREAARRFRQLDEREGSAAAYNNLGDVLFLEGHLVEARKMLLAAIPEYEAIEESSGVALVFSDLGNLARAQGELQEAEGNYQRAQGIASGISDNSTLANVLSGEADVAMDRGDLTAAGKSYADALRLRTQIGEMQNLEESKVSIAKLSIEEGLAATVESALRKSKEQFHREHQADDEIAASATLAEALLAENKLSEATDEIEATARLASNSQNQAVRLAFQLTSARVLLRAARYKPAFALLQEISSAARKSSFAILGWESQLVRAELLMKTGHVPEARQQLLTVEKSTHLNGFERLKNKAVALRQ